MNREVRPRKLNLVILSCRQSSLRNRIGPNGFTRCAGKASADGIRANQARRTISQFGILGFPVGLSRCVCNYHYGLFFNHDLHICCGSPVMIIVIHRFIPYVILSRIHFLRDGGTPPGNRNSVTRIAHGILHLAVGHLTGLD